MSPCRRPVQQLLLLKSMNLLTNTKINQLRTVFASALLSARFIHAFLGFLLDFFDEHMIWRRKSNRLFICRAIILFLQLFHSLTEKCIQLAGFWFVFKQFSIFISDFFSLHHHVDYDFVYFSKVYLSFVYSSVLPFNQPSPKSSNPPRPFGHTSTFDQSSHFFSNQARHVVRIPLDLFF